MERNYLLEALRGLTEKPVKPRVFVSYHHDNDQWYYDRFNTLFSGVYDILTDRSVDRKILSDDPQYQRDVIRGKYITGTSITIVLSGVESWKRKFIDWEICATLNKEHAVLGIVLPSNPLRADNTYAVPDRLFDNLKTGFAYWIHWTVDPAALQTAIGTALLLSKNTASIDNSRGTMQRNLA